MTAKILGRETVGSPMPDTPPTSLACGLHAAITSFIASWGRESEHGSRREKSPSSTGAPAVSAAPAPCCCQGGATVVVITCRTPRQGVRRSDQAAGGDAVCLHHDVSIEEAWITSSQTPFARRQASCAFVNNAVIGDVRGSVLDDDARHWRRHSRSISTSSFSREHVMALNARAAARFDHQHLSRFRRSQGLADSRRYLRSEGRGSALHQGRWRWQCGSHAQCAGEFVHPLHHRDSDLARPIPTVMIPGGRGSATVLERAQSRSALRTVVPIAIRACPRLARAWLYLAKRTIRAIVTGTELVSSTSAFDHEGRSRNAKIAIATVGESRANMRSSTIQ